MFRIPGIPVRFHFTFLLIIAWNRALRARGCPAEGIRCVGAAEMLLTDEHMIVRFDYHVRLPAEPRPQRFLVDVDMSFGRLVDANVLPLGALR